MKKIQSILTEVRTTVADNIMADEEMLHEADSTRKVIIIVSIVAVLAGILMAWVIASGILGPLRKGLKFVAQVSSGNLSADVDLRRKDELGTLADGMQNMVNNLRNVVSRC